MDRHRQIAFISAFILALVIMMLGKACTDSMMKKQSKPVQSSAEQSAPAYNNNAYNYNNSNNSSNGYNNAPQQTTAVQQTEIPVQYVTNMFGEVVGTESVSTEYSSTDFADIQTTTQERSILEQYNKEKQGNASSAVNPSAENTDYQIPSEIKITIN